MINRRFFLTAAPVLLGAGSLAYVSALAANKPMKVALILPARVNDPGYYNAGYIALLAVRAAYGAETAYQENLKPADAQQVLRAYAEDGFTYVIAMGGGNYDDAIRDVVRDYPDLKVIIISGGFSEPPNIVSVRTGNPGVAYLAGVLMAGMSKTGKIGLIGGRATPPAIADHVAIIAGARSRKSDINILTTFTENYEDPALGKEAAVAQIEQGVDIIFTNANTTSFGVFQAAQERGVLAVGAATDQNSIAPNTILTSTLYGMDNAVKYIIDLDRSGKNWEKKVYTQSLELVDLAPFHGLDSRVPETLKQTLVATRADLLAGKITVPTSYAQINMKPPTK